ncbi:hypothetical protein EVAR_29177_1 [Eumeta japonica]|uniref:Uncharacterized protein n=1 Tax=Eumeta variegata TaxID=151549 RepID=A0A4C1VCQ0_EUMVA|nr:hypothetical protein EVAR_29177_1 [Eumeta japonica]
MIFKNLDENKTGIEIMLDTAPSVDIKDVRIRSTSARPELWAEAISPYDSEPHIKYQIGTIYHCKVRHPQRVIILQGVRDVYIFDVSRVYIARAPAHRALPVRWYRAAAVERESSVPEKDNICGSLVLSSSLSIGRARSNRAAGQAYRQFRCAFAFAMSSHAKIRMYDCRRCYDSSMLKEFPEESSSRRIQRLRKEIAYSGPAHGKLHGSCRNDWSLY